MQTFKYKAWDENFNIVKGRLEEDDAEMAKACLRSQGYVIISIKKMGSVFYKNFGRNKLDNSELASFCGQMNTVVSSGVSLLKGIEVFRDQAEKKRLRTLYNKIYESIEKGNSLSYAMRKSGAFPGLLCDMVSSGELSGDMETIFRNMEILYEREARIKDKMRTASVYPLILLFTSTGMLIFFNYFIFPEFQEILSDSNNLPLITKILVGFLQFFKKNAFIIAAAILSIMPVGKYVATREKTGYMLSKASISLPIIGRVRKDVVTSRFARAMSLFLKSAVPVLQILDSLGGILGNEYMSRRVEYIRSGLTNGYSVADAMEMASIFDPIVIQMVRVGEETGSLDESLEKVAQIYDKKSESGINKLMAVIEPVFTLLIGVFIGILLLAMMLPVMQGTTRLR